jgi:hypothetical protein
MPAMKVTLPDDNYNANRKYNNTEKGRRAAQDGKASEKGSKRG